MGNFPVPSYNMGILGIQTVNTVCCLIAGSLKLYPQPRHGRRSHIAKLLWPCMCGVLEF